MSFRQRLYSYGLPSIKRNSIVKFNYLFWLLFFIASPLQAKTLTNVIFFNPEEENIFFLQKKYKAFYIIKKSNSKDTNFLSKIRPHHQKNICLIKNDDDEYGMEQCVKKFIDAIRPNSIDYIIDNATDSGILIASKIRTKFKIQSGLLPAVALALTNKAAMKQRISEADPQILTAKFVLLPKNRDYSSVSEAIGALHLKYPIMIKLTESCGSIGVHKVDNDDELKSLIPLLQDDSESYLAEEYIEGETLRIDGYITNGEVKVVYPAFYDPCCYDYYQRSKVQVTYTDFSAQSLKKYHAFAQAVMNALDYNHGIFHLEAIQNNKGVYFLEIAARPGEDSVYLRELYKYDAERLNVDLQIGIRAQPSRFVLPSLSVQCATVDCPTPPYEEGAYQMLTKKPRYKLPKDCHLLFKNDESINEEIVLQRVPVAFMSFGFTGRKARLDANQLRDSLKAGIFEVKESRNGKKKRIPWPYRADSSGLAEPKGHNEKEPTKTLKRKNSNDPTQPLKRVKNTST